MLKVKKQLILLAVCLGLIASLMGAGWALATTTTGIGNSFSTDGRLGDFAKSTGYGQEAKAPEYYVGLILNIVFSLLGIIVVGLIIFNGFNWMTARGNEKKVEEAKSSLISAIIGLLIVLGSYAITTFVFKFFI